mmetsp:Transcript_50778/g.91201  ORF Transcript_50778/g.91201 Transcript_50778/m.91201 type:complete len:81 (+) Transcript_50778:2010-2252(+)
MREYIITVVCSETKYMKPKETRIEKGIEHNTNMSKRKLFKRIARMPKGNQRVLISCTGTSWMSVSFIARFRKVGPVTAMS